MPHWRVTGLLVCTCWHLCHNETERPARCSETHLNRQTQVDSVFGLNIKLKPEDYYSLWLRAASKSTLCQTDWLWTLFLCNEDCVDRAEPSCWSMSPSAGVSVSCRIVFFLLDRCDLCQRSQFKKTQWRSAVHHILLLISHTTKPQNQIGFTRTKKSVSTRKYIFFTSFHTRKRSFWIYIYIFFIWLVEKNHPEKMILSWIFLFIIFFALVAQNKFKHKKKIILN